MRAGLAHWRELSAPSARHCAGRDAAHGCSLGARRVLGLASEAVSPGRLSRAALQLAAALVLGVFLFFAYRKRAPVLGGIEASVLGATALALVALPIWVASDALLAVYVILAIAAGVYVLVLPADFAEAAPWATASSDDSRSDTAEHSAGGFIADPAASFGGPLRWLLVRSTLLRKESLALLLLPIVVVGWARSGGSFLIPVFFALLGSFQYARGALNVTRGLSAWPLGRGRLLPYLALPPLVLLVLAVGFVALAPGGKSSFHPLADRVDLQRFSADRIDGEGEYATHVRVPAHHWRLHRVDQPVLVTAPWGETAQLEVHPFFWGAPWGAFHPFDVARTSSARFVAWQLERALDAQRGASLPQERLLEDYLGGDPAALASELRVEGVPWADGLPPSAKSGGARNAWFGVVLAATVLWASVMALVLRRYTPAENRRGWRRRRRGLVLVSVGAGALFLVAMAIEMRDPAILSVMGAIVHRSVDGLLGSRVVLWVLLDALALAAVWVWLGRRFLRMEVPPPSKTGWSRREVGVF